MSRGFRKTFERFCRHRVNRVISDVLLALVAGYLTITKFTGWSFSSWVASIFHQNFVPVIQTLSLMTIVYSVAVKVALIVIEFFPADSVRGKNPEGLNHCVIRVNDEIARHLFSVKSNPAALAGTFDASHQFEVNLALIAHSLSDHIVSTLKDAKRPDIFISVYQVPGFEELPDNPRGLNYVTHFDNKRDHIRTREIDFSNPKLAGYECVKCSRSEGRTVIVLNCQSDYQKGHDRRHSTTKHYIGLKLAVSDAKGSDNLLGFVNVEFHNKKFFQTEEEMQDYLESNLVAFKYLFEYQFLKRTLFRAIVSSITNPEQAYEAHKN